MVVFLLHGYFFKSKMTHPISWKINRTIPLEWAGGCYSSISQKNALLEKMDGPKKNPGLFLV
jgi:hypothetical protein